MDVVADLPPERHGRAREAPRQRRRPLRLRGARQRLAEPIPALPGGHQERPRPRTRRTPTSAPPSNVVYKGADWLRGEHRASRPTPWSSSRTSRTPRATPRRAWPSPVAVDGRRARRQLRQRLPGHRRACRLGARLAARRGRRPGPLPRGRHDGRRLQDALSERRRTRSTAGSARTPGSTNRCAPRAPPCTSTPIPTYGYLRGLTGDLDFTTTEWRDAAGRCRRTRSRPSSATSASTRRPSPWPPRTTACRSSRPTATASATASPSPTALSENAFVDVVISQGRRPRAPAVGVVACAVAAAPRGTAGGTTAGTSARVAFTRGAHAHRPGRQRRRAGRGPGARAQLLKAPAVARRSSTPRTATRWRHRQRCRPSSRGRPP